jgi:hypothetical protein
MTTGNDGQGLGIILYVGSINASMIFFDESKRPC